VVFASHAEAHREAGLNLLNAWRDIADANNVFCLFEVAGVDRARAFCEAPESAAAGEAAGVVDGEFHFVEEAGGY